MCMKKVIVLLFLNHNDLTKCYWIEGTQDEVNEAIV